MSIEPLYVPFCTIYENRIQIYDRNLNAFKKPKEKKVTNPLPTNKKYLGKMTKSGKKTIEKRLTAWLLALECYHNTLNKKDRLRSYRPVFITLTLSEKQKHSDYFIKRNMLQVFIKNLQYNYNVKHYFWKAERQKNGNIHFHILVDRFIHMKHIQIAWNRIQEKQGYTEKYSKEYFHHNPPSTHVEGKPKNSSLIKYMLKYVSKHDNSQSIQGSVFRFSKSLLVLKPFNEIVMGSFANILGEYLEMIKTKDFIQDYCTTIYFSKDMKIEDLPLKLRAHMKLYYVYLYHLLYDSSGVVLDVSLKSYANINKLKQGTLFCESDMGEMSRQW